MSGGSLNYFHGLLEDHAGDLGDKELGELVKDLAKVFHDREWSLDCDIREGAYIKTVKEFKEKWFSEAGRKERFTRYIEEAELEIKRLRRSGFLVLPQLQALYEEGRQRLRRLRV